MNIRFIILFTYLFIVLFYYFVSFYDARLKTYVEFDPYKSF